MSLSVPQIVLVAKKLEIAELKALQSRVRLVGVLGHMVHVLQTERGASSIYLASAGKRFEDTRQRLISESGTVERVLRQVLEEDLTESVLPNAKILSLVGWVMLGLDALPELRNRIGNLHLAGHESVSAFSRLIAGLIALIFELADAAVTPAISRRLVSLFNLIEAQEHAGQERAVGALLFGGGVCDAALRERVMHLIEAQENSLGLFLEFAEDTSQKKWRDIEGMAFVTRLNELRAMVRAAAAHEHMDSGLADAWFDACSERVTAMWSIQRQMVQSLQKHCTAMIEDGERELSDSQGLLKSLRENAPARANAIDRFLDPALPIEQGPVFGAGEHDASGQAQSIVEVLQAQSRHLADVEKELASAKKALVERKIVDRAKGQLMEREGLSEDEAYKRLRQLSMDRNMRLADVAEAVLASHS